jgi:hypothetical protein
MDIYMTFRIPRVILTLAFILAILLPSIAVPADAQSRPQRPTTTTGSGKKNERPYPLTEEEKAKIEA